MSVVKPNNSNGNEGHEKQFVRHYLDNMRRLYSYIFAFVPNRTDADDIFQEVTVIMWQKYESFATDAGFFNWAVKITRNKIKQHIQKQSRDPIRQNLPGLRPLDDCALSMLREHSLEQEALRQCIARMKAKDQELLRLRYEADTSTQSVAAHLGRGVSAIYKALNRIHYQLLLCIQGKLAGEDSR